MRDVLGHADLKTTERYLHAVRASWLSEAATRAFMPESSHEHARTARAALLATIERLGDDEAGRLLRELSP